MSVDNKWVSILNLDDNKTLRFYNMYTRKRCAIEIPDQIYKSIIKHYTESSICLDKIIIAKIIKNGEVCRELYGRAIACPISIDTSSGYDIRYTVEYGISEEMKYRILRFSSECKIFSYSFGGAVIEEEKNITVSEGKVLQIFVRRMEDGDCDKELVTYDIELRVATLM
ncbi:hypothetical protein [Parabacteroides sp. ZJ-118]|uniref:hypothetical protein n=1 Tax=Parabacteroides sp. ZJ-118 TaxID=2709398 RepID=UPI0013ED9B4D|nr:hypothetical protein [Parabacteroides sp. ZJ-118]